jgi:hypothetical protein
MGGYSFINCSGQVLVLDTQNETDFEFTYRKKYLENE